MPKISDIQGFEVRDSRGGPTLETSLFLDDGSEGVASVPSGIVTGRFEAKAVPVPQAIETIRQVIKPNLLGLEATDQKTLDRRLLELDGTPSKENLGGNTTLAVSLAAARAAAAAQKMPLFRYLAELYSPAGLTLKLPTPMFNIINGGAHAANNLTFQEFMVVPADPTLSFEQKMAIGVKIMNTLREQLKDMNLQSNVGEEGGFAPALNANEEAIELLVRAVERAGLKPRLDVKLALDIAAGVIPDLRMATHPFSPLDYYKKITTDYPIELLEDPFSDDDWGNWIAITKTLGGRLALIGDDFFATNPKRLKTGIEQGAANAISIKPNQIGTLSETLETIRLAKGANFSVQISHRSGETEDTFIADLAVAVGAAYLKAGAPNRGERVAKYNQLLRIEKFLGRHRRPF